MKKDQPILWLGKIYLLLSLSIGLTILGNSFHSISTDSEIQLSQSLSVPIEKSNVLGESSPEISISTGDYRSGNNGLISQASTDEPSININGYNLYGEVELSLYTADENLLFDYLLHDKDGKQLRGNPDVSKLNLLKTIPVSVNSNKGTKQLLPISGSGIWFITAKYQSTTANAFIIRSSVAVLAKEGDNEIVYWGQNLATKRSITDGSLRVLNLRDSLQETASAAFDSGLAKTPASTNADIAVVKSGQETSIVPLNLRYLNVGWNYTSFGPKERESRFFTFTDRPLYKPGDTIYFKSIIRDDDDARYSLPTGLVKVNINKSYGEENIVYSKNHPVSSDGTISGSFQLPENSTTGDYYMTVNVSDKVQSFTSFQVELFRKPEFGIDISSANSQLIFGTPNAFSVNGTYFSGEPLANQSVKYRLSSSNYYQYSYLNDDSNSLSDDYRYGYWGSSEVFSEGNSQLDANGLFVFNMDYSKYQSDGKNKVYSFEVESVNGSGSPSFSRKNILVYAGGFDILRGSDGYYTKVGTTLKLPIILNSHFNNNVSGINLSAKIHRTSWTPRYVPDKKYPEFDKDEEELPGIDFKSDGSGKATLSFVPQKVGSYEITVSGRDQKGNLVVNTFYSYVSSEEPVYYDSGQSGLSIKANKSKYLPTDSVSLNINSTIADRDIFLSFERGRLNRYQVVRMNGRVANVDLPLTNTDIPNIFLRTSSFSDRDLDTTVTNIPVSTDSKKLIVKLTPGQKSYGPGDDVAFDIESMDSAGNPVSAEFAVWAVDKALFELSDNRLGSIFNTFWNERYNDTNTSHSLEGIMSYGAEGGGCFTAGTKVLISNGKSIDIESVKVGSTILTKESEISSKLISAKVKSIHQAEVNGYLIINGNLKVTTNHKLYINGSWQEANIIQIGDSLTGTNSQSIVVSSLVWQGGLTNVYNLELEKYHTYFADGYWVHNEKGDPRKIFKDTAYWNPSVRTDASGRAKVNFKLPDDLTTWVITALGANLDTKVGQTTAEIQVTKNVIVRPALPNIFRIGDKITVSALTQNFTDSEQLFDIDLTFDSGTVSDSSKPGVAIKSQGTHQAFWQISPEKENSESKLIFRATDKNNPKLSDSIVSTIPVRIFGYSGQRAETGNGSKEFSLTLSRDTLPEKSSITLHLAPTLLGSLPTAFDYLIGYPYGCVEQTTSRIFPALIAKENSSLFSEYVVDKNLDEIINKGIDILTKYQHGDGGWGFWEYGNSSPLNTVYALEMLTTAKGQKFNNTDRLISEAKRYLENVSFTSPDNQVIMSYGLTLVGSTKAIRISNFDNLTPDLLSLAILNNYAIGDKNPDTNGVNKLISIGTPQGDGLFWAMGSEDHYGSVDASTALAIRSLIAAKADKDVILKGVRYLSRNRTNQYWSNTFATSQVIRAIISYSKLVNTLDPNLTYQVSLDGNEISSGTLTSPTASKQISIPLSKVSTSPHKLNITQTGNGELYSTLIVKEFRTDNDASPVSHGLTVKREYLNTKGAEYSLAVGDVVTVAITLSGLNSEEHFGVIVDELPSGLIPINESFKNQQFTDSPSPVQDPYAVSDQQITENGAILSIYLLPAGEHTFTYKARVISQGTFAAPPATATLMYAPEIYGSSKSEIITVGKESQVIPGILAQKDFQSLLRLVPLKTLLIMVGLLSFGVTTLAGCLIYLKKNGHLFRKRHGSLPPTKAN